MVEATNRLPKYNEKTETMRIISRPAGLWQLQECHGKGTREYDPWEDVKPATDYQSAIAQLAAA